MSVLDRAALEQSPLADLHAIASELSIDGYRRLRRGELIDAIVDRQAGEGEAPAPEDEEASAPEAEEASAPEAEEAPAPGDEEAPAPEDEEAAPPPEDDDKEAGTRRRRGRRGGRGRGTGREDRRRAEAEREPATEPEGLSEPQRAAESESESEPGEDQIIEGVVELLPGGSGFVRVDPPDPSDDDVYISAAQVKRCELVSGDRVVGPRRAPRRSERFASMVRIDTINGLPAEEVADSTRFEELAASFPDERFRLGSEDPTIKAIEWLTPFGRGSRVTVVGPGRAGKTEALRRLAAVLAEQPELQLFVVLAGVRPEEIPDWSSGEVVPAAAVSMAASAEVQGQTIERILDQGRRFAARGADAVVLIDTLDGLPPHAARKLLAAARNLQDGGSLTVIATASTAIGGETTVIALDAALTSTGRFPAVDLVSSGTIKPDLLVGEAGAEAIARARAEAMEVSVASSRSL